MTANHGPLVPGRMVPLLRNLLPFFPKVPAAGSRASWRALGRSGIRVTTRSTAARMMSTHKAKLESRPLDRRPAIAGVGDSLSIDLLAQKEDNSVPNGYGASVACVAWCQ